MTKIIFEIFLKGPFMNCITLAGGNSFVAIPDKEGGSVRCEIKHRKYKCE